MEHGDLLSLGALTPSAGQTFKCRVGLCLFLILFRLSAFFISSAVGAADKKMFVDFGVDRWLVNTHRTRFPTFNASRLA